MKIAWQCKECSWLQVSDDREHHKMDVCPCRKSGLDLEKGYARMMGSYLPLLVLEDGVKEWKVVKNGKGKGKERS